MNRASIIPGRRRTTTTGLVLVLLALITACSTSESSDPSTATPSAPATIASETPEQDPTLTLDSQSSNSWIDAVAAPATGGSLPDQFFFSNGPDLWLATDEGNAIEVLLEKRIGPHADTPDGTQTAVVFTTDLGSRAAEEIRFVDAEGNIGEPVYGPVFLDGPGSKPPIKSLVWTNDGQRLALIRYDASVSGLQVVGEIASIDSYPIFEAGIVTDVERFAWSPSGDGAALLGRDDTGIGRLQVLSANGADSKEVAPNGTDSRSIGAFDWIPEAGELVVAEDNGARNNPNAGTLFSLSVDGEDRKLLISSGEFGPVVSIPIIRTSPAGDWVAFAVYAPGINGAMQFDSLWIFEFATSVLIPIPVGEGFRVTDVWWTLRGLSWRGVDINAPVTQQAWVYEGSEPFAISSYEIATGQTSKLMSSRGR